MMLCQFFLKGRCISDLLNSLFVPSHRMLLWEAKRVFFFSPLEWHKNKSLNSYYIHTYGLYLFSVEKKNHFKYLILSIILIIFFILLSWVFLYSKSEIISLG